MLPLTVAIVVGNSKLADELHAVLRDLPVYVILRQPEIADCVLFSDQLSRLNVDVLFLGVAQASNSFDEIMTYVRHTPEPPFVVAIADSSDPEKILASIRSGADDYVYPPVAAKVHSALGRAGKLRGSKEGGNGRNGKILAFTSAKGGCGATTIAIHAAASFQRLTDQKVLLADLDLDAGLIAFLMKVKPHYSLLDAASNLDRLDPSYWKALAYGICPRLDVVPAPEPPVDVEALDLEKLRDVLRFLRSEYDWIVLDLGRSLGRVATAVMPEIDSLFLVATPEVPALYQAGHLAATLREGGCAQDKVHFLANRMTNTGKKSASPALQLAETLAAMPVYAIVPNGNLEFYTTYQEGKLISSNSYLAKAVDEMAKKLIDTNTGNVEPPSPSGSPVTRLSQIWTMLAGTH
jgi:pilus assembly protein CpaE